VQLEICLCDYIAGMPLYLRAACGCAGGGGAKTGGSRKYLKEEYLEKRQKIWKKQKPRHHLFAVQSPALRYFRHPATTLSWLEG